MQLRSKQTTSSSRTSLHSPRNRRAMSVVLLAVLCACVSAGLFWQSASLARGGGAERNNLTGLIERKAAGLIPAGTRSVEAVLQMTRWQGIYNDGYADNISLVLD